MKCQICQTEEGVRGYEVGSDDHGMGPPPIQLCDPCVLVWHGRRDVERSLKGDGDAKLIFQTQRKVGNQWVTLYYRLGFTGSTGIIPVWSWCDADGRPC